MASGWLPHQTSGASAAAAADEAASAAEGADPFEAAEAWMAANTEGASHPGVPYPNPDVLVIDTGAGRAGFGPLAARLHLHSLPQFLRYITEDCLSRAGAPRQSSSRLFPSM